MKLNLRQPGDTTNISDDYATHQDRGSLGGDDLTDPYGTTVHAQLNDAYVSIVDNSPDGSGGRYSRVTGPDGDSVESLHQHSVTASRGQRVNEDDPIGVSGASAYGSNYGTGGPHIHNHGVRASGARFNLEHYYWWLNGGRQGGGNSASIAAPTIDPRQFGDIDVPIVIRAANYPTDDGGADYGAFFTLAPQFIRHETFAPQERFAGAGYSANVFSTLDELPNVNAIEFQSLLTSLAIPLSAPRRITDSKPGGHWTMVEQLAHDLAVIRGDHVSMIHMSEFVPLWN